MNSIDLFLQQLARLGVRFWIQDEQLHFKAPKGALTVDMQQQMAARKTEIRAAIEALQDRQTITKIPRDGKLPLSFSQQRLWFMDQWYGPSPVYNEPAALRLNGPLNQNALQMALQEIVNRHEVFRTTFSNQQGHPQQHIHAAVKLQLPTIDLSHISNDQREAALQERLTEQTNRTFDLNHDLMLKACLFILTPQEHVLCLVMHHIACDGWSAGVLIEELTQLYPAFCQHKASPLLPLPLQYADFAHWQRHYFHGNTLQQQLDFWRQHLANAPAKLDLPTDFPRPAQETFNGARYPFQLSLQQQTQLQQLANRTDTTLFMLLLAVFKVLLYRHSQQYDIVVGSAIANRNHADIEALAGFFVNTLALRSDLSGNPSFLTLLQQIRGTTHDAYQHQDLPFEKLVEEIQPDRSFTHTPLFQVMFSLQNTPRAELQLPGLTINPVTFERPTAKFDLILFMQEQTDGLQANWEYNTDLFSADTMQRFSQQFNGLVSAILENPETPIEHLNLLAPEQHQQLLTWNHHKTDYPRTATLTECLDTQVKAAPTALAVQYGEQTLSYAQLAQRSDELAQHLIQQGVQPQSMVAIAITPSCDLIIAIVAILKAGATYVSIDIHCPLERLQLILADCEPSLFIAEQAVLTKFTDLTINHLCIDDNTTGKTQPEKPAETSPKAPHVRRNPNDPAYVIYTSGSTGKPKGVVVADRAIIRLVSNTNYLDFASINRMGQVSNSAFDAFTFEIWGALLNGASLIGIPKNTLLSPNELAECLRQERIDTMFLTSALFHQVAMHRPDAFQALHTLLVGGETVDPNMADKVLKNQPPQRLLNVYGPTEATTFSTWYPIQKTPKNCHSIPIGKPLSNTTTYILDPHFQLQPIGLFGELFIGGDGLAIGYLNRPELTHERFIKNPFGPGRLYRTGDRARLLADGNIEFGGRHDDQIKLRGFRIELGEIETILAQHQGIEEAVVTLRHDQSQQETKQLVAYLRASAPDESSRSEHVTQWQALFENTYHQKAAVRTPIALDYQDASLDFSGWNSSYNGQPIEHEQMRCWVDDTVAEIRQLKPRRVLEIGCGTGLLLARLAPHCEQYHGTDTSMQVLSKAHQLCQQRADLRHVSLSSQAADNTTGLQANGYDTIILNSVIQYFPSLDYLISALTKAAELLTPDGKIYLGDIRNYELLEAYQASILSYQAKHLDNPSVFTQQVTDALLDEEELLVSPLLFKHIQQHIPALEASTIQLKPGAYTNELTRFRYQVVLTKSTRPEVNKPEPVITQHDWLDNWLDWRNNKYDLDQIQQILDQRRPDYLALQQVANTRLQQENQTLQWMATDTNQSLPEWLQQNNQKPLALNPAELWALAQQTGYHISISWSLSGSPGAMDVLFQSTAAVTRDGYCGLPLIHDRSKLSNKDIAYTNDPLLGKLSRKLIPQVRHYLKQQLPEYMLPSAYVMLARWPLTANGKIDRQSLPAPGSRLNTNNSDAIEPSSDSEKKLALIWQQILGLEYIGTNQNFFAIGGHSLLATQIVSRIRDDFELEIGLQAFFEHPTIDALAEYLDTMQWALGKPQSITADAPSVTDSNYEAFEI